MGLLALLIGVVYLLPFPLPCFADARYQFTKRNGLLDSDGTTVHCRSAKHPRILRSHGVYYQLLRLDRSDEG